MAFLALFVYCVIRQELQTIGNLDHNSRTTHADLNDRDACNQLHLEGMITDLDCSSVMRCFLTKLAHDSVSEHGRSGVPILGSCFCGGV